MCERRWVWGIGQEKVMRFRLPSLEEQADVAEKHNVDTLFFEVAQLVASEPNNVPASRLIEMWVRLSVCWSGTCLARC